MQNPPHDGAMFHETPENDHHGGQLADIEDGMIKMAEATQALKADQQELRDQITESIDWTKRNLNEIKQQVSELKDIHRSVEESLTGMDRIAKVAYFRGYDRAMAEVSTTLPPAQPPAAELTETARPKQEAAPSGHLTQWLRDHPGRAVSVVAAAVVIVALSAASVLGEPYPSGGDTSLWVAPRQAGPQSTAKGSLRTRAREKSPKGPLDERETQRPRAGDGPGGSRQSLPQESDPAAASTPGERTQGQPATAEGREEDGSLRGKPDQLRTPKSPVGSVLKGLRRP